MNIAVNAMQGPARALVSDLADEDKQQLGNAMVSGVMGLASIVANLIGAQFLNTSEPYLYLFTMGMVCVIASVVPTLFAAQERQHVRKAGEKMQIFGVFVKIYKGFRYMSFDVLRIALVFFFSWCGYSPFMIYATTFFGRNVEGGDPDASPHKYQEGVKLGMYAQACFAGVSFVYSLMLPYLIRWTGVRITYFTAQALGATCFILFLFFDQLWVAFLLTAAVGVNFTAFNSVPFALLSQVTDPAEAGMFMGVLNSGSVVAQTVTNSAASPIINWKNQNVAWGIAFGGIFAGIASVLVWILPSPNKRKPSKEIVVSE